MATTANFNAMLKRYMPFELLVEEMKKRNYFWNKVNRKKGWKGGTMEVPFEGGEASSLNFGALTSESDIAEGEYVMGLITAQPELWGTMVFNQKDLDRHGDMEASYLSLLPGKINQFIGRMTERVSLSLLGDGSIAVATIDGTVGGVLGVDHPERFSRGEKVVVDDGNSAPITGYVSEISINTPKTITLVTARGGATPVDLSPYTVAQAAKVYLPDAQTSGFTSLKSQLLSAANGGSASLFGQTKATYQYLQALNHDGSGISATNVLSKMYDFYYDTVSLGKGNPTEIICSFKHFKNAAKDLETNRRFTVNDKKSGYGFRSLMLSGSEGDMTITAVRDMADDFMGIMDWSALDFHGDKFFDRQKNPDGDEFYTIRTTSGYKHIIDTKFYGDLVVAKPSHMGIIHGISYVG